MTVNAENRSPALVIAPRLLLEALADPALVIDAQGVVRCTNERLARLRAEGAAPLPFSPEGDRLVVPPRIRAVLEGELDQIEIELPTGGSAAGRWSLLSTSCAVDGGPGALLRLVDLGTRAAREQQGRSVHTLEETLASTRRFLESFIDSLPLMIFVKNKEHRYIHVNKLFEEFYGAKREYLIGKNSHDILPKEQADVLVAQDDALLADGKVMDIPEQIVTTPGSGTRIIHMQKIPMPDPEGRSQYLLGVFEDITERKRLAEIERKEMILRETQRRLLEVIRELSTPILPIHPGIIVVPLVGQMDSSRSAQFTEKLLTGIQRHGAEVVIIDITGVAVVDSAVANHLVQATRAASLLGATCVLVGSSPEVATTLVTLGISFGNLITQRDLEAGFRYALGRKGAS